MERLQKIFNSLEFLNQDGEFRKVGVEIEYSNLSLKKSAKIIKSLFGGNIVEKSKYDMLLEDSRYGDFSLELDAKILQKIHEKDFFGKLEEYIGEFSNDIESMVDKTSKKIVPFEIATPPVPIKDLKVLDELIELFRLNGALGTSNSLHYAFGVHFNIEPPSENIEEIVDIFKSFLLLQKWIEMQSEVDVARKISPYINDFPKEYIKLIFTKKYKTKDEFLKEYLEFNPTRNRVLDMLPLLAFWNEKSVKKRLPKEKISPRPTYHYRLPNSKVDMFRWSLLLEFELWLVVELLAKKRGLFRKLEKEFLILLDEPIFNRAKWIEVCQKSVLKLLAK